MSELAPSASIAAPTWADRLSMPVRVTLLALVIAILVTSLGLILGIAVTAIKREALPATPAMVLAAAIVTAGLTGWASWTLGAHWRQPGRSAYERRYSKMLVGLFAAGLPVGVLIGMAGVGDTRASLFSNAPLDPTLAAIAAAALVMSLVGTLILYHRAIDDHEQQAYLWANSFAFYFLALALPAAWLLARGGLIPAIGIGSAMLILLAAFLVNFAVWAWLKYR